MRPLPSIPPEVGSVDDGETVASATAGGTITDWQDADPGEGGGHAK